MVDTLVTRIEEQLQWGNGKEWSNSDFETLSEQIFEVTKKRLSVTTLKRIWGRAERIANPSSATLNILSEFIGYTNWRAFVQEEELSSTPISQKTTSIPWKILLSGFFIVVIVLLLAFYWPKETVVTPEKPIIKSDFSFTKYKVSEGLPNSVIFSYDATAAPKGATVAIQQDWDSSKRMTISATDSIATSMYYHPGIFKSKLVVNDTIVKETDVLIATLGWVGLIEKDSIPIYLEQKDFSKNGQLVISANTLQEYHMDARTHEVKTSLYHVADYGSLFTDDFELNLQLQNTFLKGRSGCQWATLYLLYDGGAIHFPIAKKGCVSKINLMLFNTYISGKTTDLSGFGVETDKPTSITCSVVNNTLAIKINNEIAYSMNVPLPPKKIMGLSLHFEGTGVVKDILLKNSKGQQYLF